MTDETDQPVKSQVGHPAPFPAMRANYLRLIAHIWGMPSVPERRELRDPFIKQLMEEFEVKLPFKRVELAFSLENRPLWKPVGTRTGWYGFYDQFRVTLPQKPEDENDQTTLLAEYMLAFPSMLGEGKKDGIEAPDSFAEFGLITGRLIALTWDDEKFSKELFGVDDAALYGPDARDLVQEAMGMVIPWNFELRFAKYKVPKKEPSITGRRFSFASFPNTVIRLNLPNKPDDLKQSAIALAAYNDSGTAYPFTCP